MLSSPNEEWQYVLEAESRCDVTKSYDALHISTPMSYWVWLNKKLKINLCIALNSFMKEAVIK